ncbi:MAG: hypothetical protein JXR48_00575 [Candidatus Delongbacteria bacterium]|nr:hypothetical protein [Candidatus Delongbacteria bacterium]MBN2833436.1 hypothetical protein [Candidatus Delongbacteria bacterium]
MKISKEKIVVIILLFQFLLFCNISSSNDSKDNPAFNISSSNITLSNSCKIKIYSGLTIDDGNFIRLSEGTNLSIDGNLIDNNTSAQFLDDSEGGDLSLSGTSSAQSVLSSIPLAVNNLHIDNLYGVQALNSLTVNSILTLNGMLNLGDNTIYLPSNLNITGDAHISMNENGGIIREVNSLGLYNFPCGDIENKTQLEFNLKTGILDNSSVKISVVNSRLSVADEDTYLNRYWKITTSGISNGQYDVKGSFILADIHGEENYLKATIYDGTDLKSAQKFNIDHSVEYNDIENDIFWLTGSYHNDPLMMTDLGVIQFNEDSQRTENFEISDNDDDVNTVQLYANSNDQTILKNTKIILSGSGTEWSISMTPEQNAFGDINITLTYEYLEKTKIGKIRKSNLTKSQQLAIINVKVLPVNDAPVNIQTPSISGESDIRIGGTLKGVVGIWNDNKDNNEIQIKREK